MRKQKQNKNSLTSVVHPRDESVFVSGDVKNCPPPTTTWCLFYTFFTPAGVCHVAARTTEYHDSRLGFESGCMRQKHSNAPRLTMRIDLGSHNETQESISC